MPSSPRPTRAPKGKGGYDGRTGPPVADVRDRPEPLPPHGHGEPVGDDPRPDHGQGSGSRPRGPAPGDGRGLRRDRGTDLDPQPGPRVDRHVQRHPSTLDRRPGGLVRARAGRRDRDRPDRADFQVDRILKPAYRLEVDDRPSRLCRRRADQGHDPGIVLRGLAGPRRATPGRRRVATGRSRPTSPARRSSAPQPGSKSRRTRSDREVQSVSVSPRRAEEGQIQGASRDFLVFPSSRTITAESRIATGRVRVAGTINALDRAGLERDLAAGVSPWEVDPRGAPVGRSQRDRDVHRADPGQDADRHRLRLHREADRARSTSTRRGSAAPDRSGSGRTPRDGSRHRSRPAAATTTTA